LYPAGTDRNVPPEILTDGQYDPSKEAVRSIGNIIYEMLYGRTAYTDYITYSDVILGLPNFDNLSAGKCIHICE
jgi:hypothetical protein